MIDTTSVKIIYSLQPMMSRYHVPHLTGVSWSEQPGVQNIR